MANKPSAVLSRLTAVSALADLEVPGSLVACRPGRTPSRLRCLFVGDAISGVALDEDDFLCLGDFCDVRGDPFTVGVLADDVLDVDPCKQVAGVCSREEGRLLPEHFTLWTELGFEGVLSVELLSFALRGVDDQMQ